MLDFQRRTLLLIGPLVARQPSELFKRYKDEPPFEVTLQQLCLASEKVVTFQHTFMLFAKLKLFKSKKCEACVRQNKFLMLF